MPTENDQVLVKEFVSLLRSFASEIEKLNPVFDWGKYEELTGQISIVADIIERELHENKLEFEFDRFHWRYFNGKSPQGEIWDYLSWNYPDLKELSNHIDQKLTEIQSLKK